MENLAALIIAGITVTVSVVVHFEILRAISGLIPRLKGTARTRMLVVIGGVLIAHLIEIWMFAIAFMLMHDTTGLGEIAGQFGGTVLDFFYFSATSYTTLGVGDLYPHGPLRLVAGIEALTGFVLIGWSASFTYLAMEKFWDLQRAPRSQSS